MAIQFHKSGPIQVYFADVQLGICENGVDIAIQPFFEDIHTDAYGGLAGPFADRQFLGGIASINCLFTKFDENELEKLTSFKTAGTAGTLATLGSFVYQDSLYAELDLRGTVETISFNYAHIATQVSFNASLRHKRFQVGFIARVDDPCTPILWDAESGISCSDT